MKKKIIFFDADGTLWYPKETKREEKQHWVYEKLGPECFHLLELTPGIENTLKLFQMNGYKLVVVSANPSGEEFAVPEIMGRLNHFDIAKYFDSVRSSDGSNKDDKGRVILEELEKFGFKREEAIMVGDSFSYDYQAAQNVGVDAVWIENDLKVLDVDREKVRKIKEVSEIINLL